MSTEQSAYRDFSIKHTERILSGGNEFRSKKDLWQYEAENVKRRLDRGTYRFKGEEIPLSRSKEDRLRNELQNLERLISGEPKLHPYTPFRPLR